MVISILSLISFFLKRSRKSAIDSVFSRVQTYNGYILLSQWLFHMFLETVTKADLMRQRREQLSPMLLSDLIQIGFWDGPCLRGTVIWAENFVRKVTVFEHPHEIKWIPRNYSRPVLRISKLMTPPNNLRFYQARKKILNHYSLWRKLC